MSWRNREPNLSGVCAGSVFKVGARHEVCGGWMCTCDCHDDTELPEPEDLTPLLDIEWREIGGCVYAGDRRLYVGTAPASRSDKEQFVTFLMRSAEKVRSDWAEARARVAAFKADAARSQHRAGYEADRRAADGWLRRKYRKQWQARFDQLRAARAARPDEPQQAWADSETREHQRKAEG